MWDSFSQTTVKDISSSLKMLIGGVNEIVYLELHSNCQVNIWREFS